MSIWLNYSGKGLKFGSGIKVTFPSGVPPFTIRFDFYGGFDPSQATWYWGSGEGSPTWTNVGGNVWDWHYANANWFRAANTQTLLSMFGGPISGNAYVAGPLQNVPFDVIDANIAGVDRAPRLFWDCRAMRSIAYFDTKNVREVGGWFERCVSLETIPDFDFSGVRHIDKYSRDFMQFFDVSRLNGSNLKYVPNLTLPTGSALSGVHTGSMFRSNKSVISGALALYNKLAPYERILGQYTYAFSNCGSNTPTGQAELAQIPTSWGGTAS